MALQTTEVNVAVAPQRAPVKFVKELRRRQGLEADKVTPKRPGYDLATIGRRLAYAMKDYAEFDLATNARESKIMAERDARTLKSQAQLIQDQQLIATNASRLDAEAIAREFATDTSPKQAALNAGKRASDTRYTLALAQQAADQRHAISLEIVDTERLKIENDRKAKYNNLSLCLSYAREWYQDEATAEMWRDAKKRFNLTIATPREITAAWVPVNTSKPYGKDDTTMHSSTDEDRAKWGDWLQTYNKQGDPIAIYDDSAEGNEHGITESFYDGSDAEAQRAYIAHELDSLRLVIGKLRKEIKAADIANTPHLFGTADKNGRLQYSPDEFAAMRAPALLRDQLQRHITHLDTYGKQAREVVMGHLDGVSSTLIIALLQEQARFIHYRRTFEEKIDPDLEPEKEFGKQSKQIIHADVSLSGMISHEAQDHDEAFSWQPSGRDYTLRYLGMPREGLISNIQRDMNEHDETTLSYRAMAMDLETFFAFFRARPSRNGKPAGKLPFNVADVTTLKPVGLEDHLKAFALCIWSDELSGNDDADTYFQHFAQLCDSEEMAENVKEAVYAANLEPRPNDQFLLACYQKGR